MLVSPFSLLNESIDLRPQAHQLQTLRRENMCHKSVKTNLFTAVKNQILHGEILNGHRTGTYNVDYRYMHLVWL
jgi:hypothetical protein